jgi:hypothetical protein
MRRIVYVIGGLYGPTGMGRVLSMKANYFANRLDYKVYVILTENRYANSYYKMSF